ncbi:hypothetical protein HBI73_246390 [Parastagonospora nodorum]|nr:hypothetical protein HBI05_253170 [Parastagonospora nodorum]KAH4367309.1 hypothetical protein HBH99_253030 [Parastagonospora nodorum]KAH4893131.1 hypothetical protein HBI80_253280 [Parastagonospora nodorum]KAH4914042.1 hypothetical protein HBH73_253180 [Parastagonospora nodorum]KAH5049866.1 hypothetical protein HBI73_246390 [Parastagonospora nodorum]
MGNTEKRKIQNKLAQRRRRERQKALTGHEDLTERNRRADPNGGLSSNLTAQSDGDCVSEQQSTLVPHHSASSTTDSTDQSTKILSPCHPGSRPLTDHTDPFFRSPQLNLKFGFPPSEDLAIAKFQYEVTSNIFQWLVPTPNLPLVQVDFLRDVVQLWHRKESVFRRALGAQYDAIQCVFEAWIKERLEVAKLFSKLSSQSGLPPSLATAIDRIHILNALRKEKLTLLYVCADEKIRNELLAKVFCLLTETTGTDDVFLHGIGRLQREDMSMLGMIERQT